ncbi:MAG TPA: SPOR domain-containing protein [Dongiaceae bacterium]|nr:SPOR domain-containing protein [Dongiaceae bacterium]
MDFKFSKESGDSQPGNESGEKKKQSALLALLLILVGGFTYLYFFTPLIKPQEEQKTVETPAPAPQIVKMPLPARVSESVETSGKTPEKTEAPKAAASAPVIVAATAAKTAAVPAKPAAPPAAKPAPAPVKQKEEPKKTVEQKPADKKPQPEPVAAKKDGQAAAKNAEAIKPVVAGKKSSPAKESVKKPVSAGQAKSAPVIKAKKAASGPWTLMVGNYVLEEALSAEMGRVRKAGFEPVVKPAVRTKTTMNRLLVSEFNDRASAQASLEKLKRLTSDAFIIEQGGKFVVYAGSYLQSESARSEKERLNSAGVSVTVKHTEIAIPAQSLSIGPFKSKKSADVALGKLKSAGIQAKLLQ